MTSDEDQEGRRPARGYEHEGAGGIAVGGAAGIAVAITARPLDSDHPHPQEETDR